MPRGRFLSLMSITAAQFVHKSGLTVAGGQTVYQPPGETHPLCIRTPVTKESEAEAGVGTGRGQGSLGVPLMGIL